MNIYIVILFFSLTVFTAVLAILIGANRNRLSVTKRLEKMDSAGDIHEAIKIKKAKKSRKVETKFKLLKKIADELSISGILIKPSEFLVIWIVLTLLPASIFLLVSQDFIVAMGFFLIGLIAPPYFVHLKRVKRVELFERQLVDGVAIICNCLKSGLTFHQAIESLSNEMPEPISKEFGRVVREVKLGNSIDKALTNMSDRLGSEDFMLIVSAVLIQRQIGGSLSEILSNMARTTKQRYIVKSEIKTLTTTGRTSGKVVGFMPIAILLFFMVANPDYVRVFMETKAGNIMMIVAGVLELIGFMLINKIVNIKF